MPASTAAPRPVVLDGDLDPTRYAYLTPQGVTTAPSIAQLTHVARTLASRPPDWRQLLRFDPAQRWRLRLDAPVLAAAGLPADPGYQAWVMTWLPGQRTGMHDHGDAAAVIAVAYGELHEHSRAAGGATPLVHRIRPDRVRIWGARHVREIANESGAPAVSIHVYAPPLPGTG